MVSCRDNTCVVSLFFDDRYLPVTNSDTESQLRTYIEAIRERFTAAYADKVEPIRPILKNIADGKKPVRRTCIADLCSVWYCTHILMCCLWIAHALAGGGAPGPTEAV